MQPIYHQIRQQARLIVSRYPTPDFYRDHAQDHEASLRLFDRDPIIKKLLRFVTDNLEDDFGHGLLHAVKVSHDAGALVQIEAGDGSYDIDTLSRWVCMVQSAGLLHDIKRKKKDHSTHAAAYAKKVLKKYPFTPQQVEDICCAIQNHEAFKDNIDLGTPLGELLSNCLYDADKFRWGPDNFKDTIWDMKKSQPSNPLSEHQQEKNSVPNLSIMVWPSAKNYIRSSKPNLLNIYNPSFLAFSIKMFWVTDHTQSGWLGFSRHRWEKQTQGSALIGAGATGCTAPG
jgi:hypothetical protein